MPGNPEDWLLPVAQAPEEPTAREPSEVDLALWAAFSRHDRDGDGHLALDELVDALTDLEIAGHGLRAARLRREVAPQLELDGLDFAEFCGVADALVAAPRACAHDDDPAPPTVMLARAFSEGVLPPPPAAESPAAEPPAAEAAADSAPLAEAADSPDAGSSDDAETGTEEL